MRVTVACVASVSSRVIARKLEREPKKKNGRGRGKEDTLARKPHDSGKRPLDISRLSCNQKVAF